MGQDTLSTPLNARQIAKALLPSRDREDERVIFEEFLLWPPDLFAFTSHVFSITGAYNMAVSPHKKGVPSNAMWPPNNDAAARWASPKEGWIKYVREIGFAWRANLAGYRDKDSEEEVPGNFDMGIVEACKHKNRPRGEREKQIQATVGRLVGEGDSAKWEASGNWVPKDVGECWAALYGKMGEDDDVEQLLDDWEAFKLLMTLHAIVDEACVGWGIRDIPFQRKGEVYGPDEDALKDKSIDELPDSKPADFAASRLRDFGTIATIDKLRCRVLPKRHTPSIGITLRSLTNNLAYHRSSVDVKWIVTDRRKSNDFTDRLANRKLSSKIFSVLLLPWPRKVNTLDFKVVDKTEERLGLHDKLGLFHYKPEADWLNPDELNYTLENAKKEVGNIDMVVLPECALSHEDIETFERIIGDKKHRVSAYVAGVRRETEDEIFTDNMVYFKMGYSNQKKGRVFYESPGTKAPDDYQHKHHRWKVDRFQIENYSLGYVLSPNMKWWESIRIRPRKVTFINVGNELTICPLICEDLARQDPIADLIRTVGPSLVITILMDGPQTKERWSARYASVLSEDPGSAVITLTSAGMVDRWRRPKFDTPRAIALWNDGQGSEREIVLEKDSIGILLSLSVSGVSERSADGRLESYPTNRVILGGIHQVRMAGREQPK
ncbi:MAG TPA: hypothetical protein VIP46_15545 [Pyrinomonadaceae bacterium]